MKKLAVLTIAMMITASTAFAEMYSELEAKGSVINTDAKAVEVLQNSKIKVVPNFKNWEFVWINANGEPVFINPKRVKVDSENNRVEWTFCRYSKEYNNYQFQEFLADFNKLFTEQTYTSIYEVVNGENIYKSDGSEAWYGKKNSFSLRTVGKNNIANLVRPLLEFTAKDISAVADVNAKKVLSKANIKFMPDPARWTYRLASKNNSFVYWYAPKSIRKIDAGKPVVEWTSCFYNPNTNNYYLADYRIDYTKNSYVQLTSYGYSAETGRPTFKYTGNENWCGRENKFDLNTAAETSYAKIFESYSR